MITIGYGRVSTASGEQLSALRGQLQWVESVKPDRIFHDVESGLNVTRAGYNEMLALIEQRSVGTLYATRADRLGRDGPELVRLIQRCDQLGVAVVTRDDGPLSAKTPEELLMLYIRAALAQGESMKISDRVRKGLAEGRLAGRPMRKPCWGYRLNADRTAFELDPVAAPLARRFIEQVVANDWKPHAPLMASRDVVPFGSVRAVRCWLLNPVLRGGIGYGQKPNHQFEQLVWNLHEPLLTHEEFASYRKITVINARKWGNRSDVKQRALTGLCECAHCGRRLKYITDRKHNALRCNSEVCAYRYKGVRERLVMDFIISELRQKAAAHLASSLTDRVDPEAVLLQEQIDRYEALADPMLKPVIDQKRMLLEAIQSRPATVNCELVEILAKRSTWDNATYEELTAIFRETVKRVRINQQQPESLTTWF